MSQRHQAGVACVIALDSGMGSRVHAGPRMPVQRPHLRIGELARLNSLSPDTLRHYERLPACRRTGALRPRAGARGPRAHRGRGDGAIRAAPPRVPLGEHPARRQRHAVAHARFSVPARCDRSRHRRDLRPSRTSCASSPRPQRLCRACRAADVQPSSTLGGMSELGGPEPADDGLRLSDDVVRICRYRGIFVGDPS